MKQYMSKDYLTRELKNKNYLDIAKENHVSKKTIHRWMRNFHLTKGREKWAKKEIEILKREYDIGQNVYKLFPDRSISSVNHKAHRLKIGRTKRICKYKVNSRFFDKWTSEMAYVLGWFSSDGNVSSNSNCCSIHINAKDKEILYKIRKVLNSTHQVELTGDYAYFRINDKILCSDLIKRGCTPRKSLNLKFPIIPKIYANHFIRGYFDGDGRIGINNPNTIKISFLGTRSFILSLQGLIFRNFKIRPHAIYKIHKNCLIYKCGYYGNDARKLLKWMYTDSGNLFLKRKKIIYDRHIRNWSKTYGL